MIFTLNVLFPFKIFHFRFDFLAMWKNNVIRKIRLHSQFLTSKSGSLTLAIRILTNIARNKKNQAMIFGQLIDYNMRDIFLDVVEEQNVAAKHFPDPFPKNQNCAYLWISCLKIYTI